MFTIQWDQAGDRGYEVGVDRGVIYTLQQSGFHAAVPWNGLISVEENPNIRSTPIYFDGKKISDDVVPGEFSATITAYTYPSKLTELEGTIQNSGTISTTGQAPSRFHLTYRTLIGDDVNGAEAASQIHILYNLIAIPSERTYETMSLDPEPQEFEWVVTGLPAPMTNYRPAVHYIIDSRKMSPTRFNRAELLLYGNTGVSADIYLPDDLVDYLDGF